MSSYSQLKPADAEEDQRSGQPKLLAVSITWIEVVSMNLLRGNEVRKGQLVDRARLLNDPVRGSSARPAAKGHASR